MPRKERQQSSTGIYHVMLRGWANQRPVPLISLNSKLFSAIRSFSQHFPYQGVTSNCVNWASIGLWLNGIPNIGGSSAI